jgi:hypothetical protein
MIAWLVVAVHLIMQTKQPNNHISQVSFHKGLEKNQPLMWHVE